MLVIRSTSLAVIGWLALTVLPISFALAGETITVQLASGRTFTAVVHARTDRERLWLEFGGVTAQLLRPIEWRSIATISQNGEPVSQQQVLDALPADATAAAGDRLEGGNSSAVEITIRHAAPVIDAAAIDAGSDASAALDSPVVATHIDFYATLENWDRDPYPDGLLLHLQLLDGHGNSITASGSLQAELFAPVQRRFQAVPHGRGASVLPVARWSRAISEQDYRRQEAVIRLPFSAAQPVGTDLASSHGLLHVRFAVPGHGVFEYSYDGITLRRFTPTRDLLQRQDRRPTLFTEPPRRWGNLR